MKIITKQIQKGITPAFFHPRKLKMHNTLLKNTISVTERKSFVKLFKHRKDVDSYITACAQIPAENTIVVQRIRYLRQ